MFVYFDNNATTALDPQVLTAMMPYLERQYGNPSSVHQMGRLVRGAIETAREQIADLINAHPSQIIFTSGGSEANNFAIKGIMDSAKTKTILISEIEHDSVMKSALHYSNCKAIKVNNKGLIDEQDFLQKISLAIAFVATMWVNNENGVIQNIPVLQSQIRNNSQAFWHVDAVQALGKIDIDFSANDIDSMALSSHKIFGPQGVGALVLKNKHLLKPFIHGGGQESGLRSGTENVAGIVGFGKAAEIAKQKLKERQKHAVLLRDELEGLLREIPNVHLLAQNVNRVANTSLFAVAGIDGEMLLMQLDKQGYAVSSGSACQSGTGKPSHVLQAMQIPEELAECVIRVSLSHHNTRQEILDFVKALKGILEIK